MDVEDTLQAETPDQTNEEINNDETNNEANDPLADVQAESIKLRLIGQDSNEIHFEVKTSTKMSQLKKVYAKKIGVKDSNLWFFLENGNPINDDETPKGLEMEQNDKIDVFREPIGVSGEAEYIMKSKIDVNQNNFNTPRVFVHGDRIFI